MQPAQHDQFDRRTLRKIELRPESVSEKRPVRKIHATASRAACDGALRRAPLR
jgi:hypothetical protein